MLGRHVDFRNDKAKLRSLGRVKRRHWNPSWVKINNTSSQRKPSGIWKLFSFGKSATTPTDSPSSQSSSNNYRRGSYHRGQRRERTSKLVAFDDDENVQQLFSTTKFSDGTSLQIGQQIQVQPSTVCEFSQWPCPRYHADKSHPLTSTIILFRRQIPPIGTFGICCRIVPLSNAQPLLYCQTSTTKNAKWWMWAHIVLSR